MATGGGGLTQEHDVYEVIKWNLSSRCCVYLILSGYGEIAAAAATQHLIDAYHVDKIINYGVVGGLSEEQRAGTIGFTRRIVHYGFDLSGDGEHPVGRYPNQSDIYLSPDKDAFPEIEFILEELICASADKFVSGGGPKRELREQFNADICEMEAAGIVLTCNRNGVPCTFIKAVSDGLDEGSQAFDENVGGASEKCVKIIEKLLC